MIETRELPLASKALPFDPKGFLTKVDGGRTIAKYRKNQKVFSQGDAADSVFYIQKGKVKITVLSEHGKEAVVGIFAEGQFFGEGCLEGAELRTATSRTTIKIVISLRISPHPQIFRGLLVHAARVIGGRLSRHAGTYLGGRSSPTSHPAIDGSSSGSIRSHSKHRSARGPLPSSGITSTIKPPRCLHHPDG